MRPAFLVGALLGSLIAAAPPTVVAQAVDAPAETARAVAPMPSLAPMIRRVSPAVVSIGIQGAVREQGRNPLFDDPFFRRFFNVPPDAGTRERPFQSAGSGVVVDGRQGYIITNAHVVENAREITVTLFDQRQFPAKVVGSDPRTDIAVIQVKAANLAQIVLGDSDRLEPGDYVAAIGNPFGLQQSVSYGIVSALGRSGMNPDGFESLIQTDASINPGNSGGALVNLRGELVGINNMILSGSGGNIGIGFAIPVNMARSVMDQLIKYGSVKRGQLGVTIAPVTPDIAEALGIGTAGGALVTQVVKDSAAARAGIRAGDVVTAVNGRAVKSAAEFRNAIGLLRVGDKVDIALLREGQSRKLTAEVADPAATTATAAGDDAGKVPEGGQHRALEGAQLEDAPAAAGNGNGSGVLVRAVAAGSPAANVGLRANDLIVAANGVRVGSRAELSNIWRAAADRGGNTLVLQVRRSGETTIILLR
ncbi:MAG: Do family serine endopeptidase [Gammaproteobacteria bacterium]|nr:Do family serine endopeptidase [Gammaproteobacteria bacterium]